MAESRMDSASGKFVLVTGASGGIGSAVVRALLDGGFSVIGLDLRPGEGVPLGEYTFVECDVTSPESVRAAYEAVCRLTGTLEGIVNMAGKELLQ